MWITLFSHQVTTSYWPIVPFISLLLLIALGTTLFPKFWSESYKMVSVALGLVVAAWYIIQFKQPGMVVETLAEYLSFITLLIALYVIAGGIFIFPDFESKATTNLVFLCIGAILTNIIGTTGASILLIRPYMRLNRYRLKPYHIVFFIILISNWGGLLTPIGDPPLFMGFLKGVPFFYTFTHLGWIWLLSIGMIGGIFYVFERKNTLFDEVDNSAGFKNKIFVNGKRNFIWLGLILLSVFIDPKLFPWVPSVSFEGHSISVVRELLFITIAIVGYRTANKHALQSNQFSFHPIEEVGYLFFGIFLTMMPAIQLLQQLGMNGMNLSIGETYFATGAASALLDNAPAYLNFLTFSMAGFKYSVNSVQDVSQFIQSPESRYILAISVASVFWGAFTYIGNGPNFMVKSIAEQNGVKMPGFMGYIWKYTLPILLPILVLIGWIFSI